MSNDDHQINDQIWNQLKTIIHALPCGIETLKNPTKGPKLKTQRTTDKTLQRKEKPNNKRTFL